MFFSFWWRAEVWGLCLFPWQKESLEGGAWGSHRVFWALRSHFFCPWFTDCPWFSLLCGNPLRFKKKHGYKWLAGSLQIYNLMKISYERIENLLLNLNFSVSKKICSMRSGLGSKWIKSKRFERSNCCWLRRARSILSSLLKEGHLRYQSSSVGWWRQCCTKGDLMLIACIY